MKDETFRDFRRRLFHGCLTAINTTVKPYMQRWDLMRCSDNHFRRAIYGLGPHIADYPEQSIAAGTVYGWCVTSVYSQPFMVLQTNHSFSCDAKPTDLDNPAAELRTRERLLLLLEGEDDDALWFDHGIVPDFLVSSSTLTSQTHTNHLSQPFTTNFPRADIYELLTPDLLHQVIKGTYKDHLVTWIEAYFKIVYGSSRGLQILDEVDQRSVCN